MLFVQHDENDAQFSKQQKHPTLINIIFFFYIIKLISQRERMILLDQFSSIYKIILTTTK